MLTVRVKLSVDDIVASLAGFAIDEREKFQNALFDRHDDAELEQAINEGLDDAENGRTIPLETVMKEIKARYNF